MADYYTTFSTTFPIGAVANTAPALALYRQLAAELEAAGETIGFAADEGGTPEAPHLWLYSGDNGEPEHVITFALRCAEALKLAGHWGSVWGLGCSRPRLDGFGGGAHLLDLGRRETVAWVDCEHWLAEQLAVREVPPARAEALLQATAAAQGWTAATQAGVLLDVIDGLIADEPGIADRLEAHLAATSAEPEEMLCRERGEPMVFRRGHVASRGQRHGRDRPRPRGHRRRGGLDDGRDPDRADPSACPSQAPRQALS